MTRVLITGARAPVAMHLARLFAGDGHTAVLADSLRFPLGRATRHAAYSRLPPPTLSLRAYGEAVARACDRHAADLVIPTCEEAVYLAAARDVAGCDLPVFCPSFDRVKGVHDKYSFSRLAGDMAPQTHLLTSPDDVRPWIGSKSAWIFKPVWSRFGDRVLVRPSPDTLRRLVPTPADPWVAQAFLPGEELCCHAVAYRGRCVALQAYRPLWRAGKGKGAGVMVEPVEDTALSAFVTSFIARTHWHGQISFDFRRDAGGRLYVIECNPRATTGAHFFDHRDGLPDAMLKGIQATASRQSPLGLPLAMWLYGLPEALRTRGLAQWRTDLRRMDNLLSDAQDRSTVPCQLLALGEIVVKAVRTGQGLKAAATADIEWNGGAFL